MMKLQLIGIFNHLLFKYLISFFKKKKKKTQQRALNFESNVIKMIGYCDNPKCLVTKLYERDLFSLLHDPSQR